MNNIPQRIKNATVLALILSITAVFAGARVAIFKQGMPYTILQGLPAYNLILGVFSLFPVTYWIWKKSKFSIPASIATLASHSIVLLILFVVYFDRVSVYSLGAMLFRVIVWSIILRLLLLYRKEASLENKGGTL